MDSFESINVYSAKNKNNWLVYDLLARRHWNETSWTIKSHVLPLTPFSDTSYGKS